MTETELSERLERLEGANRTVGLAFSRTLLVVVRV
jgi:hypothetical protein